jgi:hypothetical protein
MPTPCCGAGQNGGCRAVGELRPSQRRKDQCTTPPLCQGLRHRWGQGKANSSRTSPHPRRLLPDRPHQTTLFCSAHSDGSHGNTSRGGPSRPLHHRVGWQCKRGSDDSHQPQASGDPTARIRPECLEAKDERNSSWEEAEGKGRRSKTI